jgi:hypothetical protein
MMNEEIVAVGSDQTEKLNIYRDVWSPLQGFAYIKRTRMHNIIEKTFTCRSRNLGGDKDEFARSFPFKKMLKSGDFFYISVHLSGRVLQL